MDRKKLMHRKEFQSRQNPLLTGIPECVASQFVGWEFCLLAIENDPKCKECIMNVTKAVIKLTERVINITKTRNKGTV